MNDDLCTAGRRVSDNGDALTIREALDLFTHKSETAALASTIALIAGQVAQVPSRAEHQTRWDAEADRYQRLEVRVEKERDETNRALEKIDTKTDKIDEKVDTLLADRLPKWTLPAITVVAIIVIPLIVLVVTHFWKP